MEYIRPNGFIVSRHWVCKSPEIYRKDGTLSCKRFCLWPLSLIGVQTGYCVSIGHSILFTSFSQIIEGFLVLCGVEYFFFLSWKRPQWQGQRINVIIDINLILICNKPWFCVHLTLDGVLQNLNFPPQHNRTCSCINTQHIVEYHTVPVDWSEIHCTLLLIIIFILYLIHARGGEKDADVFCILF